MDSLLYTSSMSLIQEISAKDFDLEHFVRLALNDDQIRHQLVDLMVTHPDIMVYYHCYYVISKAALLDPEFFYPFWDSIAGLLSHSNSYHRNFALDIIASLTSVDTEDRFAAIEELYLSLVNDPKFNTGNECLKYLGRIYQSLPRLRDRILDLMLNLDQYCDYSAKQLAVLNSDVLEILAGIYIDLEDQEPVKAFIMEQLTSLSPKTRQKAAEISSQLSL